VREFDKEEFEVIKAGVYGFGALSEFRQFGKAIFVRTTALNMTLGNQAGSGCLWLI
jgi:hypothetical protein